MRILSLRSNVARDEALQKLAPGFIRQWLSGRLASVAEIYIPYRLYEVIIEDRRLRSTTHFAIDAATGALDPYGFSAAPSSDAFVEVETRNCHPVCVDEKRTSQMASAAGRRSAFRHGFFRLAEPSITAHLRNEFYVPYWAGFYSTRLRGNAGDEATVTLAVINAMSGSYEGGKIRKIIQEWLMNGEKLLENEFATQGSG